MLVPHFGTEKGTLVFSDFDRMDDYNHLLISGYAYSIFDAPPEGYVTPEADLIEILSDWGWCGPQEGRPTWLQDP